MITVDLASDDRWDLGNLDTFVALMRACEMGQIDAIIAGPPSSTFSELRHRYLRSGPRPLRARGQYVWGMPGLCDAEHERVLLSNKLIVNTIA